MQRETYLMQYSDCINIIKLRAFSLKEGGERDTSSHMRNSQNPKCRKEKQDLFLALLFYTSSSKKEEKYAFRKDDPCLFVSSM